MKKMILLLCLGVIALQANAQLANPGFETWDTATNSRLYPQGWPLLNGKYCTRSTAAQQGNYALTVSVWYYYTKTNAVQVTPITYKPASLSGYYTYTDNEVRVLATGDTIADTAFVSVFLTRWNNTLQQEDTVGKGMQPLFQSTSFTGFTCPVTYTDTAMPDSVTIFFDPSIVRRYVNATTHQSTSSMGYSSYLTIDNLSLQSLPTGIPSVSAAQQLRLFPNPAKDQLTIGFPDDGLHTLIITDAVGNVYNRVQAAGLTSAVSIAQLPAGAYQVQVYNTGSNMPATGRFIKQ